MLKAQFGWEAGMNRYVQSLGLLLILVSSAEAQVPTLYDVAWLVQPGDTITITDPGGVRTRGKLVELSATSLLLDMSGALRLFQESDIHQIERRGDSLKNGALIGFSAAMGSTLFLCRSMEPWRVCFNEYNIGPLFLTSAIGAGIGVGIDALIRGRRVIYARPQSVQPSVSVTPIVRHGHNGVLMSVRLTN